MPTAARPATRQPSAVSWIGVERVDNGVSSPESKREEREATMPQRLLAEMLGTFFLTFIAAGADIVVAAHGDRTESVARFVAPGLIVLALIYSLGDVSGAHFNPVV